MVNVSPAWSSHRLPAGKAVASDTFFLRYHFEPRDTIIYTIRAFDSILIDGQSTIFRERRERVRLICDSLDGAGNFHLAQTLLATDIKDVDLTGKKSQGKECSWLRRKVQIVIDSLGNRRGASVDRPETPSISSGGEFQPPIIVGLGESGTAGIQLEFKTTWAHNATEEWVENGNPATLVRINRLYTSHGIVDTMARTCLRYECVGTAQASNYHMAASKRFDVLGVMASFSQTEFDTTWKIPLHVFATQETKVTLKRETGGTILGKQTFSSYCTLESLSRRGKIYRLAAIPKPAPTVVPSPRKKMSRKKAAKK